MKVVLDTNVIIAAFSTRGLCKDLFEICLSEQTVVVSAELLNEIQDKLEEVLRLPHSLVGEIVDFITSESLLVEPAPVPRKACRDPNDIHVLGAAITAGAEIIVTGDKDLLALDRYQSISILSPRAFWEYLRENP